MSTVLSDITVKAHKTHQCWYCTQDINVGETHRRRTGVNYGDFWVMRVHSECDDYASKHWDVCDYECHLPGDEFKRPMTAFDPSI